MDLHFDLTQTQHVSVLVDAGIEAKLPTLVQSLAPDGVVVVYDTALEGLAERIGESLGANTILPVEATETAKQLTVAGKLAEQLHAAKATRATVMVAVGGGTLTDLAGFVASIYLRGIPFVSCPTTTLAMCDAALGGKNGVDHCGLKNRLGTIRQPNAIVMDTDWLSTLPDEMFREGLVEVVKKAAVLDAGRFAELESLASALLNRDAAATMKTVAMAVDMKMKVVLEDEREGDRRRALNAGHTIGHAIEALAAGSIRHGHAVAMGMLAECRAAHVDDAIIKRIATLLRAIGVQTTTPAHLADVTKLWDLAQQDKKAMRGHVPMYVPTALGKGTIVDLTPESLAYAMQNDNGPRTTP